MSEENFQLIAIEPAFAGPTTGDMSQADVLACSC